MATNVLGTELKCCCKQPATGFHRDGYCRPSAEDKGVHVVCAVMTDEFLEFSLMLGNDLVTPVPEWGFHGLKPGDRWCLCVTRWKEALDAGFAPPVVLEACQATTLEWVSLEELKEHAVQDS